MARKNEFIILKASYATHWQSANPQHYRTPLAICSPNLLEVLAGSIRSSNSIEMAESSMDEAPSLGRLFLENARIPAANIQNVPERLLERRRELLKQNSTYRQTNRSLETLLRRRKVEDNLHSGFKKAVLGWGNGVEPKMGKLVSPIYTPIETLAYLRHLALPSYHIHHQIFRELAHRFPQYQPKSILDYGCGTGSGLAAAKVVWPSMLALQGVDQSASMRDASRYLLDDLGYTSQAWSSSLTSLTDQLKRSNTSFDLVNLGFVLGELPSEAARAAAVSLLWNLVAPSGLMVITERGSAYGSHTTRSARKQVAEDFLEYGLDQGEVLSPCPHSSACPLNQNGKGEPCSFSLKIPRASRDNLDGPRTEGFSFVVMEKPPSLQAALSDFDDKKAVSVIQKIKDSAPDVSSDLMKAIDDPQLWKSYLSQTGGWSRIIRTPLKRKGHVVLDLCKPDGGHTREVISKGKWGNIPGAFIAARKGQLGGLWPNVL